MASDDFRALIAWAGGWEGFEIAGWSTEEELAPDAFGLPSKRLIIELKPAADTVRRCPRCQTPVTVVHDVTTRRVRDLPLMGRDVWLLVPQARLECPRCGRMPELITWLDRYQRITKRLEEALAHLAQEFGVQAVARLFHVDWDTVKLAHQRTLAATLGPLERGDFSGVRQIAIDEFALHKGQRYATLVVDVATRRVLWVARGRHAEALDGFFAALGTTGCARLEAVVIDLARPFVKAVRTHCPNAAIVYDLFHALQRYTAQVLDRVRFDEANKIGRPNRFVARTATQHQRRHLTGKGVRWLLLRARSNLRTPAERAVS